MVLALIHDSPATHWVTERLAERLSGLGEKLAVFSDPHAWRGLPEIRCCPLRPNGQLLSVEEIRRQIAEWQDTDRIIFDVMANLEQDRFVRLLETVDRAVFVIPAAEPASRFNQLASLGAGTRGWRDKIRIAWILPDDRPIAPTVPHLDDVAGRDIKLVQTPAGLPWGRSVAHGLERLVHDLRGVRIGVALGGGAARGMSHLGVLKALEQNGIVVDLIAGTSAGAMTGIVYSSGLDPDFSADQFARDLRPSWIFRRLPRGSYWYLADRYRRNRFDPMLRKYLHDWRLEQLPTPCLSVTVDLVSGSCLVRDRGDAIHAILESINLPVLSVPICRNGQALIDGGFVNNIPANVLAERGCNFVIAVSVTAKMEKHFCDMSAEKVAVPRKRPSILQTLLRTLLVQNHSLNAHGVQPADVVIEPDLRRFDVAEFVRTRELAAAGEAAAVLQIPRIRQLLTRLDPQLFRATN
jgi:predicted acylesterase/phospholipase RssA